MIKKFTDGLIYGGGFSIAFFTVWYLSAWLINPWIENQVEESVEKSLSEQLKSIQPSIHDSIAYQSLSEAEMLVQASALIIVRYKEEEDGLMSAYVAEIYKKDPSVEVDAIVGAGLESKDFYSKETGWDREGAVVFMTDSPAREASTIYIYDDRLAGSDMPLEIAIKKFLEAN